MKAHRMAESVLAALLSCLRSFFLCSFSLFLSWELKFFRIRPFLKGDCLLSRLCLLSSISLLQSLFERFRVEMVSLKRNKLVGQTHQTLTRDRARSCSDGRSADFLRRSTLSELCTCPSCCSSKHRTDGSWVELNHFSWMHPHLSALHLPE